MTLPRQKSALLPIVNDPVEATRVSIFNESVQAKFPLLGLRFKNTSGQNLMQGPITVYEGGTYAGDARVMDLQPNEERLVGYAIDQGTEVKCEAQSRPGAACLGQGGQGHRARDPQAARNQEVHHQEPFAAGPRRSSSSIRSATIGSWSRRRRPASSSREVYRFEVKVPAGKSLTHEVVEEQSRLDQLALNSNDNRTVRIFLNSQVTSAKVKESLQKAAGLRGKLSETQSALGQLQTQLKAITDDQVRLRANFERLPPTSEAYKRYLKKFDTQETEIEKLQDEIKSLQTTEKGQLKEYEDYLAGLTVE